ncbi:MAG: glycosyltransferase family 2 protein [Myxococcota bacterium]
MSWWPWALFALPIALPLTITLFNLATWTRGRKGGVGAAGTTVSVLIPARNEAASIEAALWSVAASRHPIHEIVVYDDLSTDETPAILERVAEAFRARGLPPLRIVAGNGLPDGWVGKPHACHQLARHATGDLLFFIDADVTLTEEAVERVVSLLERADVFTAVPRQRTGTWAERLIMPLLHLTYTSWLPQVLVLSSRDERFVAANGQLMAMRRATYDALGGFAAVRHEIVDDVAFCRHAKRRGHRVVFADGDRIASCRMYTSAREVWEGFSKNIYEGIGGSPVALLALLVVHAVFFVLPYVALAAAALGVAPAEWGAAGAAGVAGNIFLRLLLALRYRQPWSGILLHPLSVLGLCAIAVNSFRWSTSGNVRWAGRSYAARTARVPAPAGQVRTGLVEGDEGLDARLGSVR